MDRRAEGAAKARAMLLRTQESEQLAAAATLPWKAVVTAVDGDVVTVRATTAASGGGQRMPSLGASIAIGDTGVCIPLAGGGVVFAKTQNAAWEVKARLAATVSTTLATAVNITGLSFAVAAGEAWAFDIYLRAVGNTGGIKYTWSVPTNTNPTKITTGPVASLAAIGSSVVAGSGTLTSAFNTALYVGWADIHGSIAPTVAGTVQFQFVAGTAGESVSIEPGSYMVAHRIS